ncbi:MAG: HNH endonuclease [Prochlorococcaceae cyanobacterium]
MADDLEKRFPCTPSGALALVQALESAGMTNDKFLSLRPQKDLKGINRFIRYCKDKIKNPADSGFRSGGKNAELHRRMLKHYVELQNRGLINLASLRADDSLESLADSTDAPEEAPELNFQALEIIAQSTAQKIEDSVFENREFIEARVTIAKRDRSFRERVLRHYGIRCAVCSVSVSNLIEALHIQPVKDGGSDIVSNGLPLCANHHIAFDCHLWSIDPNTKKIVTSLGLDAKALGIDVEMVGGRLSQEALRARYTSFCSQTQSV